MDWRRARQHCPMVSRMLSISSTVMVRSLPLRPSSLKICRSDMRALVSRRLKPPVIFQSAHFLARSAQELGSSKCHVPLASHR
eukprot:6336867-Alexandrium_andersonii.AAC.1